LLKIVKHMFEVVRSESTFNDSLIGLPFVVCGSGGYFSVLAHSLSDTESKRNNFVSISKWCAVSANVQKMHNALI
jgi:hypothetical protein